VERKLELSVEYSKVFT